MALVLGMKPGGAVGKVSVEREEKVKEEMQK